MATKKKKWIQGAIKRPGAFSAKAKNAGMSTAAYAKKKKGTPGQVGKQARLAMTLAKMRKKKK
uniref:Uncharacterized protein n=1 Tax=viral metagenome TaxID=1070528 RepID=A0A6M3XIY3_9ZZZZ